MCVVDGGFGLPPSASDCVYVFAVRLWAALLAKMLFSAFKKLFWVFLQHSFELGGFMFLCCDASWGIYLLFGFPSHF